MSNSGSPSANGHVRPGDVVAILPQSKTVKIVFNVVCANAQHDTEEVATSEKVLRILHS